MPSNRLRPIDRAPCTPARVWRWLLLFAWLTSGTAIWAASGSGVTLTIDCAFCGPNQAFPHDCPQGRTSAAALPAPNPLPLLLNEARQKHRQLITLSGLNIPELGEAGTLGKLDALLAGLITSTEAEIERCERERAEFVRKAATADAERSRLTRLVAQFNEQIGQMRREIGETEREAAIHIQAATTARDEIRQLQKSLTEIREEIRQVRSRLFPRLHQASIHGWILPPSSYQPTPGPLPVKTQGDPSRKLAVTGSALSMTSADSGHIDANPLSNSNPVALRSTGVTLQDGVQSKLNQLTLLYERARMAVTRRADAIRSLELQRSESDMQAAQISTLEPQHAALASQLANAKRNAATARQTSTEYATRLTDARASAIYAWIECGIFQLLDKKAEALLARKDTNPTTSTLSPDWHEVAAIAVELGSDPLGVITRLPAAMSLRGETLDALQQALAGTREKFGLGFVSATADLPAPAVPYLSPVPR